MNIINLIVPVVLAFFVPLIILLFVLWLGLKLAKEESGNLMRVIKWLTVILVLFVVLWGVGNIIARV